MRQRHMIQFAVGLLISTSCLIQVCQSSRSQGVFELHLKSFSNVLNKVADGRCCDGLRSPDGRCSGQCSTRFRICLKHYQANIDPRHECTFGERWTQPELTSPSSGQVPREVIEFPLDFKWPGTFSLIVEAWHDNNKSDGKILISRMATQQKLNAGQDWIHGVHQESNTRLDYEYRMVCSAHYYGSDCDTLCRPRDDQFGHYTCGPNGEKVCLDGYQKDPSNPEGDYCTKAVCLPGCHPENGECDQPGECKCRAGWTGPFCDKCIRYPGCQQGSCREPWQCNCHDGWGGLFCNQDLNYCTNNKPCKNGATCFNTGQGSYTCSCPPGYTGTNCETRMTNECSHQPCLNGGTCQGTGVNDFMCVCPLGFHGLRCEMRAQTCADQPCKNGAECLDSKTGSGYVCKCQDAYQGVNCDFKVDSCRKSPCQNGGTCMLGQNGEDYSCKCPPGFTGERCQKNIDDCESNPCQNGGTCIDFVNDYKCYCRPGFIGNHCEENRNDCEVNPCQNGGTCHDSVNDFVCACQPGFTGKDCSVEINECHSAPCLNNGFCIDRINDFECRCLPGYSGKACQIMPDGTVMKMKSEQESDDSSRVALIATFSTLIPIVAMVAAVMVMCNKRRNRIELRRANAEAKRENELNAVHCASKSKMLDDHMIVNPLDYPKQKCVNSTNPNLADEDVFSSKDGCVYKQMVCPTPASSGSGTRSKQLNTTRGSAVMLLSEKLEKDIDSGTGSMARLNQTRFGNVVPPSSRSPFNCASSTSGASDCSSECSNLSSSTHHHHQHQQQQQQQRHQKLSKCAKDRDLPTAASIAALASNGPCSSSSASSVGSASPSTHLSRAEHLQFVAGDMDLFATEV